jgi:hypothetical protein
VKTYREPEVLRPFDRQWITEAAAVREALRRRLPEQPDLRKAVGGGLVFTHAGVSFRADGSCGTRVFTPRSCVEALSGSPEMPNLTMENRLRVLDALLEWSDRLHEQKGAEPWATSSSLELAERLHQEAVSRASSYVSRFGEAGNGTTEEGVKEARGRAFWHPHPDDPPQS